MLHNNLIVSTKYNVEINQYLTGIYGGNTYKWISIKIIFLIHNGVRKLWSLDVLPE